jgi:hypothetical protein
MHLGQSWGGNQGTLSTYRGGILIYTEFNPPVYNSAVHNLHNYLQWL